MTRDRRKILLRLIALRLPIDRLKDELSHLPWDSIQEERAELTVQDVLAALRRFMNQEFGSKDLEEWAALIECREDIDYEKGQEDDLKELMFVLANPLINGPITSRLISAWINRLESKAK